MPIKLTVKGVALTLDRLLWRAYGRRGQASAMLGEALALNPGLVEHGTSLPLGTVVLLPDLVKPVAPGRRRIVNLFED